MLRVFNRISRVRIVLVRLLEETTGREKGEMFRGPLRGVSSIAYLYIDVLGAPFQCLRVGVKGCAEVVFLDDGAPIEDFYGLLPAALLGSIGRSARISRVRRREQVTFKLRHRGIDQRCRFAWSCISDAGNETRDADSGHQACPTEKNRTCAFDSFRCHRTPSPKWDHLDLKNIIITCRLA